MNDAGAQRNPGFLSFSRVSIMYEDDVKRYGEEVQQQRLHALTAWHVDYFLYVDTE